MKLKTIKPIKKKSGLWQIMYFCVSLALVFFIWWLFSATVFKNSKAMPPPAKVFSDLFAEAENKKFWQAIYNTVSKVFISFALAFLTGLILAFIAKASDVCKNLIDPIITILRSAPTLAVTIILIIFLTSAKTSIIVGILMCMPIVYANIYASVSNIDKKLLSMAKVYNVPLWRQIKGIIIPQVTPYIFSGIVSGLGLTLKVVIAAEIWGIPRRTIGSYLYNANVAQDYPAMFMWVIVTVIICFSLEAAAKFIMRLCMPWKYPTRKNIINAAKKTKAIFSKKKNNKIKPEEIALKEDLNSKNAGLPCDNITDIKINNVSFSYGSNKIFDNLNLSLPKNQINCLLGPSGSGKTTLLNLLSGKNITGGFLSSGSIEDLESEVSYVFQSHTLIPEKTVSQNLDFILKDVYRDKNIRRKKIKHYLELVSLMGAENMYPHELSGGMAQRASLARAFAFPSKILLMDEPFKGLDIKIRKNILSSFFNLYASDKKTVIFVTHDIDESVLLGDKIFVIENFPVSDMKEFNILKNRLERKLYDEELVEIKEQIYKCFE